jgi:hypothetical protein
MTALREAFDTDNNGVLDAACCVRFSPMQLPHRRNHTALAIANARNQIIHMLSG